MTSAVDARPCAGIQVLISTWTQKVRAMAGTSPRHDEDHPRTNFITTPSAAITATTSIRLRCRPNASTPAIDRERGGLQVERERIEREPAQRPGAHLR